MMRKLSEIQALCAQAIGGDGPVVIEDDTREYTIVSKADQARVVIGHMGWRPDAELYLAAREELPRLAGVLKQVWAVAVNPPLASDACGGVLEDILRDAGIMP